MGIYYSSVGTRLINYLHHEELTIEDFAVLSPEFVQFIHNLGRKSKTALIERLNELNLNPGTWDGRDNGMTWYEALRYYKEHRLELREKYPPQYINKEPQVPEKPKDYWDEYRAQVAKELVLKYAAIGEWREVPDGFKSVREYVLAFTPVKAAQLAAQAAEALTIIFEPE